MQQHVVSENQQGQKKLSSFSPRNVEQSSNKLKNKKLWVEESYIFFYSNRKIKNKIKSTIEH